MIGKTLGAYQLLGKLGEGGMGEVYRARDLRLDRTVAVKVLSHRLHHPDSRKRFEREARVVASFNHPHICALYDVGQHDGVDFLVMEFVQGQTLAARLGRGALTLDLVLRNASQIASALVEAHRAGIVHRDLKPANIMLTESGIKLLDFGLAKRSTLEPAGDERDGVTLPPRADGLTSEGAIVGTFQYMAPEQLEGLSVDARTDLFSFGAVVFEMATGQRAFQGASHASLISAILNVSPPPISTLQPIAPPALDRLVQKCLAKDPNLRWQTARDLADELQWIGSQQSGKVSPLVGHAAAGVRRRRFGRGAAIGVVLASIVAAALLSFVLWRDDALVATRQRPVTDYPGSHGFASLSPDATMVAFSSGNEETTDQIWVKNLARGDPIQLTSGDVRSIRPTWSPQGNQIVFARPGEGLWSIAPLGGQPRRLLDGGRRPRFSADGRRLVFVRDDEIWIANADGGQPQLVLKAPGVQFVALSPDGQSIAFFQTNTGPMGDLWIVPATGGTARRLTFDEAQGGGPVFTPDGRTIVFPSGRAGSLTLWQIPAGGGSPLPLTSGAGSDVDPDVSLDGRTLVYTNVRTASSLVITDPATGHETPVVERSAVLAGARFSPTGDRIAFFQSTDNGIHVFTVRSDGKELTQVTAGDGEVNVMPKWSADGAFLYYFQAKPAVSLRRVPVGGGVATDIGPWSWESSGVVDPEGRRVAFRRRASDTSFVTVVHDRASRQETTLSMPILPAAWSRDGHTIVGTEFAQPPGQNVPGKIAACASHGPCRVLAQGTHGTPSSDDARVFFLRLVRPGLVDYEVWSVEIDGTNTRRLGVVGPWELQNLLFDVSPDNQILRSRPLSSPARLWLADLR